MFLDQKLKKIQDDKNRLVLCCDLRRRLVRIEMQDFWGGVRRTFSNLTLGMTVAEQLLNLLRGRQKRH